MDLFSHFSCNKLQIFTDGCNRRIQMSLSRFILNLFSKLVKYLVFRKIN